MACDNDCVEDEDTLSGLNAILLQTLGFTIPPGIGGFITEWLPLILNVWLAYEMLEAAEEAEGKMEEIARGSLDASEDLFEAHMDLREQDQAVYDFQNNQPLYKACNRDKHSIQASRQATQFIQQAMKGASRFDCGAKQKAIRAAQRAFIIGSMAEMETMDQYELTIEDQYLAAHYDSVVSAITGQSANPVLQAFQSSAALWEGQFQNANTQAVGAVTGVGYFGSQALGGLFGSSVGTSQPRNLSGYGNAAPVSNSWFSGAASRSALGFSFS